MVLETARVAVSRDFDQGEMMEPKFKVNCSALDLELTELLGEKPADFLVLCFDGVPLDFFGTPFDSPDGRRQRQNLVEALNDKSEQSLWRKMFTEWKPQICRQFNLPVETMSWDYRPVVSYEVSRVCPCYSEHLHAAIGLFETLEGKMKHWAIQKTIGGNSIATIIDAKGRSYQCVGKKSSLCIAEAVREFLKAK